MNSKNQGIVHIIGPSLALSQPGQTIVCATATLPRTARFATLAFGIGTAKSNTSWRRSAGTGQIQNVAHSGSWQRPRRDARISFLAIIGKIASAAAQRTLPNTGGQAISRIVHGTAV